MHCQQNIKITFGDSLLSTGLLLIHSQSEHEVYETEFREYFVWINTEDRRFYKTNYTNVHLI